MARLLIDTNAAPAWWRALKNHPNPSEIPEVLLPLRGDVTATVEKRRTTLESAIRWASSLPGWPMGLLPVPIQIAPNGKPGAPLKEGEKMTREIGVRMPPELHDRLEAHALAAGEWPSEIMRRATRLYLDAHAPTKPIE